MANMNTAKAPRVTVRKSVYRNRPGFTVCMGRGIFGTHIFTRTRATAEAIKLMLKTFPHCPARSELIDTLLMSESLAAKGTV